MRFGKRSNGWAAAGRRLFGEPEAGAPVDFTTEDVPDLASAEDDSMSTSADEPLIAGDPTQRLLTALGRFQRQVASAETGNARDGWADEGMHQLINAIEIAIGESWDDIREALTDTARILQTYEDAGQVRKCLPFLQDSYEILCLMVGDLIVGNVRSGVLQKWRERYELAVAMVLRDGLNLVEDESVDDASTSEAYAEATYPSQDAYDVTLDHVYDEETYDGAPETTMTDEVPAAPAMVPGHSMDQDALPVMESAPFDDPDPFDTPQFDAKALPSLDDVLGEVPVVEDLDENPDAAFSPLTPMSLPGEPPLPSLEEPAHEDPASLDSETGDAMDVHFDEDEGFILEPLAEERARHAVDAPVDDVTEADVSEHAEADPEAAARVEDLDAGDDVFAEVPVIDTTVLEDSDALIGGDLETDEDGEALDGADDAAAESEGPASMDAVMDEPETEADVAQDPATILDLDAMVAEAEAGGAEEMAAPDVPVAAAAPPAMAAVEAEPEPEAGTSEALLRTAQVAMRAGKVADAKRIALQLAANMARLEVEQVQEDVEGLEACLSEDAARIIESESAVADCEKTLQDRQWHIGEREASIQEKQGQLEGLRENLGGIEGVIADLDEQIRQLQERRAAEAEHAAAVEREIAQAAAEEAHLQDDLNKLCAEKAQAEVSLEMAKQQVAQFQEIQRTHDSEIAAAREELQRRLAAVAEIEHTIPPESRVATPQAEGEGLLF